MDIFEKIDIINTARENVVYYYTLAPSHDLETQNENTRLAALHATVMNAFLKDI